VGSHLEVAVSVVYFLLSPLGLILESCDLSFLFWFVLEPNLALPIVPSFVLSKLLRPLCLLLYHFGREAPVAGHFVLENLGGVRREQFRVLK
jgi:hypothetical protein